MWKALFLIWLLPLGVQAQDFDIKAFANQQKRVIGSPSLIKDKLKKPLHYREPNNPADLASNSTKNEFLDFISKTGNSNTWYYTCRQRRIVVDRTYYQCDLTNATYNSLELCRANCVRNYDCIQSKCYQVVACEDTKDGKLCPLGKKQCINDCPAPGVYNAATDRCEAEADLNSGECRYATTATGGVFYRGSDACAWYGITKVVGNGSRLDFYGTNGLVNSIIVEGCTFSGSAEYYARCGGDGCSNTSWGLSGVKGSGNRLDFYGGSCGKYVGSIQVSNCYFSGGTATGGLDITRVKIEDGRIKFYRGYNGDSLIASFGVCMECPIDKGYHIKDGVCVRAPDRVCPYQGRTCQREGNAYYCSPYDCRQTSTGTSWCAEINIENVTDNNISMFYCSGDGSWATSLKDCQRICQYYTCSKDNKLYFGLPTCQKVCQQKGNCVSIEEGK